MQPFLDIAVIPTYGNFTARIIWKVIPEFRKALFFVLKSQNGVTGFRQVGVVDSRYDFEDTTLLAPSKFEETYYKVVARLKDKDYASDPIGTFGKITRDEFCVSRFVLSLESRVIKKFTRAKIFQIAIEGKPCPVCTDKDTNQKIGISRCQTCYSTGREGGYLPGLWTYFRIMTETPRVKADSSDGAGTSQPTEYKFHMLAFPALNKDDLLVDPATDRRYLVDTTDVAMFMGKIPITMNATTQLLRKNDIRYTLPVGE